MPEDEAVKVVKKVAEAAQKVAGAAFAQPTARKLLRTQREEDEDADEDEDEDEDDNRRRPAPSAQGGAAAAVAAPARRASSLGELRAGRGADPRAGAPQHAADLWPRPYYRTLTTSP